MRPSSPGPRRLALHEEHERLGAHLVEVDGWLVPQFFTGIMPEYRALAVGSVVWDASNLASLRVDGPGAAALVQGVLTNDVDRLAIGATQYSLLLDEGDATVLDEVLVWRIGPDDFVLVANAISPLDGVLRRTAEDLTLACSVADVSADRVVLAVQGRDARPMVGRLLRDDVGPGVRAVDFAGAPGFVAGTAFGGMQGFELHVPLDRGAAVYRQLVEWGAQPTGVGLRETRRLEKGLPHPGVELVAGVTPAHADLMRAVRLDTDFVGREALLRVRAEGPGRVLRSVLMDGRRIPRTGDALVVGEAVVGSVTSGNFSPSLHRGVGLAFVDASVEVDAAASVDGGRTASPARLRRRGPLVQPE